VVAAGLIRRCGRHRVVAIAARVVAIAARVVAIAARVVGAAEYIRRGCSCCRARLLRGCCGRRGRATWCGRGAASA